MASTSPRGWKSIAKPGAICLSEQAYWQVKGRLDLAVSDLGPIQLKNIAEPIRVYSLEVGASAHAKPAPVPAPEKSAPPRLSIVVLPFANIGGEPEQEHFVDGVTESLTTDLSRIRGAFVDRPQHRFHLQGQAARREDDRRASSTSAMSSKAASSAAANRMRVNVQLIDAETGNHLWAERFDKPLADLFEMQDEIVARLANALNAELVAAEARRAEQAANPNSMDLYFQGWLGSTRVGPRQHRSSARLFRSRARRRSRQCRCARWIGVRRTRLEGGLLLAANPMTALAAAEAKMSKALSSVPDHARGHMFLGFVDICDQARGAGYRRV